MTDKLKVVAAIREALYDRTGDIKDVNTILVPLDELRVLEADARRYQWLKEEHIDWLPPKWNGGPQARHDMLWYCDESDLDKAIDAAIDAAAMEVKHG